MSCCIERAVLDALRSLTCTPIKSENHFIDQRECENCVPYLVLKSSSSRTQDEFFHTEGLDDRYQSVLCRFEEADGSRLQRSCRGLAIFRC